MESKTALVLQGGGMRGIYTAGVLDVLMHKNISFPFVIGTSAGALNACSFVSNNPGRTKIVMMKYMQSPRCASVGNYLLRGYLFDFDYLFHEVPKEVPFDWNHFNSSPIRLLCTCTSFQTGKPVYFEKGKDVEFLKAVGDERLTPYYPTLVREVTKDDILKLLEIKMQRILKFNKDKADELMARLKAEIEEIERDLANLTEVTANWFQFLKDKYGKDHPRLTEIRNFDTIEASKVAEANQKLYINRTDGFIGTSLKKDEFVCNCSDLDDVIIFYKDGKYKIVRVAEKLFVGKNVLYLSVFKKNDSRTIYNAVYRDGKKGWYFIKRFNVTSMTRDKEYDLTIGTPGSKVMYIIRLSPPLI